MNRGEAVEPIFRLPSRFATGCVLRTSYIGAF